MTTLEVSNLGRYGFLGGKAGSSLADQQGAVEKIRSARENSGEDGEATTSTSTDGNNFGLPTSVTRPGHRHGSHGIKSALGAGGGWLLSIVGLDLYTKGKAGEGLKRASKAGNPFDRGMVVNCKGKFSKSSVREAYHFL